MQDALVGKREGKQFNADRTPFAVGSPAAAQPKFFCVNEQQLKGQIGMPEQWRDMYQFIKCVQKNAAFGESLWGDNAPVSGSAQRIQRRAVSGNTTRTGVCSSNCSSLWRSEKNPRV